MKYLAWAIATVCWVLACWWALRPMQAKHPNRVGPIFSSIDANDDGWIRPDEAAAVLNPTFQFDQLDLDGDGQLGPAEVEASIFALDPLWWVEGPE